MPVFQFTFGPHTAGCCHKVVIRTPWDRPVREQPSQQFPQGRVLNPPEAAHAWLLGCGNQRDQYGNPVIAFPPNAQPQCVQLGAENGPAQVLALELFQPTVDRQQVNAPYGAPVGHGHRLTMPPQATKERAVPQGCYEPIHDCGLAGNDDPLLGAGDPEGGTYTDLDSMGNEVVRQHLMPQGPNVHDRR